MECLPPVFLSLGNVESFKGFSVFGYVSIPLQKLSLPFPVKLPYSRFLTNKGLETVGNPESWQYISKHDGISIDI